MVTKSYWEISLSCCKILKVRRFLAFKSSVCNLPTQTLVNMNILLCTIIIIVSRFQTIIKDIMYHPNQNKKENAQPKVFDFDEDVLG